MIHPVVYHHVEIQRSMLSDTTLECITPTRYSFSSLQTSPGTFITIR